MYKLQSRLLTALLAALLAATAAATLGAALAGAAYAQNAAPPAASGAAQPEAQPGASPAAAPVDTKQAEAKQPDAHRADAAQPDGSAQAGGQSSATPKRADAVAPAAAQHTAASQPACPGNPDALGTSRILPIDFSDYQRIGRMQYRRSLPLNDKEVVLTFDDGPLPPSTNHVLDILASQCVKATFFLVGSMARSFPAVVRRIYEDGHTIGTHSENHPLHFGTLPLERMRAEIDGGIADVATALGDAKYLAPFFRIPGLERSPTLESELAQRQLITFSSDAVADDWHHGIKPNQIIELALKRLEARGKGVLLLHDIHPTTAAALPGLLKALKDNGFHIVQVVPSPAYLIAMAARPAHRMLASASPDELTIGNGLDGNGKLTWPVAKGDADSLDPDVALPVPDASAFQPDSGGADDDSAVQWPEPPKPPAASEASAAHHGRPRRAAARQERGGERDERVAAKERRDHDSRRAERAHRRHHERAHAGSDEHSSDVMAKLKAFAAEFSAPPAAH